MLFISIFSYSLLFFVTKIRSSHRICHKRTASSSEKAIAFLVKDYNFFHQRP
ncbi:hypothetical protein PARMER_03359 [Parabacteroides merdae ATCC 43184]|nr:hypothetical protein PARMER_03359 [Parabacteroides merdae ATCC 43184]